MMEYLKDQAILQCDKGKNQVYFIVTSNEKIKLQNGRMATIKDNIADKNIKSFGSCKLGGACKLDKSLKNQELTWIEEVSTIKIGEEDYALLDTSKLICPIGGIISAPESGQI